MKHAAFGFETPNIGDDVQSIAAALLLPKVDAYVDRDGLDNVRLDDPHTLIMNSWFAIKRYQAVPSASLRPVYFGFCVGRPELMNPTWLYELDGRMVGCRDRHSVETLLAHGIEAYFSGCLTTWMGKFIHPPKERRGVLFVDVPEAMERFIPDHVRRRAERRTAEINPRGVSQLERFRKAAKLLDELRSAELVVTRRLHTALPCVGFETPVVVYLEGTQKNRNRFSGSDELFPVILHDGPSPIGPSWVEPSVSAPTKEMEAGFQTLLASLGTTDTPRWASVAEFVETLPDIERHRPASLRNVACRWLGLHSWRGTQSDFGDVRVCRHCGLSQILEPDCGGWSAGMWVESNPISEAESPATPQTERKGGV